MKPRLHHRGQQSDEKDTWQLSSFSELHDWAEGKGGAVRTAVLQFSSLVSAEHLCKNLNLKCSGTGSSSARGRLRYCTRCPGVWPQMT